MFYSSLTNLSSNQFFKEFTSFSQGLNKVKNEGEMKRISHREGEFFMILTAKTATWVQTKNVKCFFQAFSLK